MEYQVATHLARRIAESGFNVDRYGSIVECDSDLDDEPYFRFYLDIHGEIPPLIFGVLNHLNEDLPARISLERRTGDRYEVICDCDESVVEVNSFIGQLPTMESESQIDFILWKMGSIVRCDMIAVGNGVHRTTYRLRGNSLSRDCYADSQRVEEESWNELGDFRQGLVWGVEEHNETPLAG